jgi:uncharacterized delta-60 repeat protein
MRTVATIVLFVVLHGLGSAARPGDLDPSFGGTGTVRVPVSKGTANDVLVFPDGSIVVGGTGDTNGDGTKEFLLARIDATGGLVPDFGDGGLAATTVPLEDEAKIRRLALDLEGRIVAAGVTRRVLSSGSVFRVLQLARYFPNGEIDREFGFLGTGTEPVALARDVAGIVVLEDRTISLVGTNDNLIQVLVAPPSGLSFDEVSENSDGRDLVRHGDGLLVGGTLLGDFFVQRHLPDSNVDTQFGDAGSVRTSIGIGADQLRRIVVLPDGKIVAVGSTQVGPGDRDIALVRYTAGGILDGTFGDGGIVVTPLSDRDDDALDAVLAPDGTMLVAGRTCSPSPCHGFLARLLPDGGLDPAFGEGGVVPTERLIERLAIADDGHVVALEQGIDELVVHRFVIAGCGNARVEAGEACDDGNNADGDCCSVTCTLEADDSLCGRAAPDDGSACTADVCRAGVCAHLVPTDAGCFTATSSSLARPLAGQRLRWTWQSTTPVDQTNFGDPTDATNLTVCFIDPAADESTAPLLELAVPAGGVCDGAPCWKKTVPGFRYKDATAAADGVAVLRLASGASGSRIVVKAKNVAGASDLPVPVRVRLVRQDAPACFEADLAPAQGSTLELR